MLLISSTIQNVFKRVFFLLMAIEILLLGIIMVVYRYNILKVSSDVSENRKKTIIKYRDMFNLYLKNKYDLLIDDLLVFMKGYDGLNEWKKNPENEGYFAKFTNSYINSSCAVHGGLIPNTTIYSQNWYSNLTTVDMRLKSTWYQGEQYKTVYSLPLEDREKLLNLCVLNEVMGKLVKKHIRWLDYISGTMDYYTFIYSNAFFVKYPVFYNVYMYPGWVDSAPIPGCVSRRVNDYDPKCRPSFYESTRDDSNIVLIKPYKMASNNIYGSDICLKSKAVVKDYDERMIPELIACIKFSFTDIQLYRDQIEQTIGTNKRIYIIYFDGRDLTVVFDSEKAPENYKSYGKDLGINTNAENLFFEALFQNIFDDVLQNSSNKQEDIEKLKTVYPQVIDYYKQNIDKKLLEMLSNYQSNLKKDPLKTINISNYYTYPESDYYFNLTSTYDYFIDDNSIALSKNIIQDFFLFPITISFSYENDYNLKVSQNPNFYLLFVDTQKQSYENVSLFFSIIILEISLYFFFILGVNIFIWVIFGMVYFYFFKGFFKPLKNINDFYKEIFLVNKEKENSNTEDINVSSLFSSNKRMETNISRWIYELLNLSEYQEIHDCMIILKILKIFRFFKKVSTKNLKLHFDIAGKDSQLENVVDAFFYLMHNISDIFMEDPDIDSDLIVDLINNNFIYKVNSSSDREEVEMFYEDISQIVEGVLTNKVSRRSSHFNRNRPSMIRTSIKFSLDGIRNDSFLNKSSNSRKSEVDLFTQERKSVTQRMTIAERQMRISFTKLKEKLQYRYCVFRMKCIEDKYRLDEVNKDILDYDYDSEEDLGEESNEGNGLPNFPNFGNENPEQDVLLRNRNKQDKQSVKPRSKSIFESDNKEEIKNIVSEFERYFFLANETGDSITSLKHIGAHITQAELLLQIDCETDGIRQCIHAMEKIKGLQSKIGKFGNLSKFAYLSISTLFFERILYLFSTLAEKFDQKKTQFYIYLNMLDLGPVYDRKIRSNILQKLLDYLNKTGLDYMKLNKDINPEDVVNEVGFVNSKLVRHKVRALLNMSKTIPKNILLMLDLNLPFLKERNFHNILLNAINKNNHFFYFSCFDHKLHVYRNNKIFEDCLNRNNLNEASHSANDHNDSFSNQNYFINNNIEDQQVENLLPREFNDSTSQREDTGDDCNSPDDFLDYLNDYQKTHNIFLKGLPHRVDLSIHNVVKFHMFNEYPKNNNFLIVFTTIDSGFSFQKENIIQISKSLYESEFSLILCILNDERIYSEEKYQRKLECYKKFIEGDVINGHVFILKSFSLLKYVINCVSPLKFKEFDLITMKTFLESIDLNFCDSEEVELSLSEDSVELSD